jgi:hypothetical protein
MEKCVRIGSGSGFTLDSELAMLQLLAGNPPEYIVLEHMAEGGLTRLAQAQAKNPDAGYLPTLFDVHLNDHLGRLLDAGVKIVTNGGGLNPRAAAALLRRKALELSRRPRIAFVEGDNVTLLIDELREEGFRDMFTGEAIPSHIICANAYLGAFPIALALSQGADIVITGRVADSALTLGPLIHEFGWTREDYDRLAAGTMIGHLLECGAHATGGTFTDWLEVEDVANIGYPIAECHADGSAIITKQPGTGGLVSVGTVSEQVLYEVSNPAAYLVPDVSCDLTAAKVEQVGVDRVRISGVRGSAPNGAYKVSALNDEGWIVSAIIPIMGMNAIEKGRRLFGALLERTRLLLEAKGLPLWDKTNFDLIGSGESFAVAHGANAQGTEVLLRMAFVHADRRGAEIFHNECAAAGTNACPGNISSLGQPQIWPVHRLTSLLIPRDRLQATVTVEEDVTVLDPETAHPKAGPVHGLARWDDQPARDGDTPVPLVKLAWGRSGDKGNLYNIGIIARDPDYLPYIRAGLTEQAVAQWMAPTFDDRNDIRVDRYEVPAMHALNFVCHNALGGGNSVKMNIDCNAKTMAQRLLMIPIKVPAAMAKKVDV